MDEIAESLRRVSQRIDEHNAHRDPEAVTSARLAKLAEEVGEVASAWLGVTGQNPRKGHTHTRSELQGEVLDVAVTALALWEHLDGNQGRVMDALTAHVRHLDERGNGSREHHADVLRTTGSREYLISQLRNMADGCLGSDELRAEAAEAAVRLEGGQSSVRVGHMRYVVTSGTDPGTLG